MLSAVGIGAYSLISNSTLCGGLLSATRDALSSVGIGIPVSLSQCRVGAAIGVGVVDGGSRVGR